MKTKLLVALTMTAALAITSIISGCATAPMASQAAHTEALTFTPPFGMANIYIIRDSLIGAAFPAHASLDNAPAGNLPVETYVMRSVPPGTHTVGCINPLSGRCWDPITFNAQAGQSYFFVADNRIGWLTPRFFVRQISTEEARKMLKDCERVQGL